MFKNSRLSLLTIFLLLAILQPQIAYTAAPSCKILFDQKTTAGPIKSTNWIEYGLLRAKALLMTIAGDTQLLGGSLPMALGYKKAATEIENTNYHTEATDSLSKEDFLKLNDRKVRIANWGSINIKVNRYGGGLDLRRPVSITIDQLKAHFDINLKPELAYKAKSMIDLFYDTNKVDQWIVDLEKEVANKMWNDGIRSAELLQKKQLREVYFDKVLSERAVRQGFKVQKNGRPFNVLVANHWIFFRRTLTQGQLFIDWAGASFSLNSTNGHFGRSHMLQLVYAAENIPNYIDLIKHIGRTEDKDGLWQYMFDNNHDLEAPFWSGKWISTYRDFLGIRF